MIFVDFVTIEVNGGKGGDGIIAFRREKHVPLGGPSGGDGGKGGDVYIIGDENLMTLQDYRYLRKNTAESGIMGKGSTMTGHSGEPLFIRVPIGTIVKDSETKEFITDIVEHNQKYLIAEGGRGGLGNPHFATALNKAPRKCTQGKLGEQRMIDLELKVLADVGLVGHPNAGKSTFLSVVSNAKPKIADYPFTTLEPNLGIVKKDYSSFVIADIPGLIEGASDGKGLGIQFLKHIERTKVLLYMISVEEEDIYQTYKDLRKELEQYSLKILDKPEFIAFTKNDIALYDEEMEEKINESIEKMNLTEDEYMFISSVSGHNIDQLKYKLWDIIVAEKEEEEKLKKDLGLE